MSVHVVERELLATPIDGLTVLVSKQITDERGTINELFRRSAFVEAGLGDLGDIRQINLTSGRRGTLRGMHAEDMTKLLGLVSGTAQGAYVDCRPSSPTSGHVHMVDLRPGVQVLVRPGIANGFQVTSDDALYLYAFDAEWQVGMAGVACSPLDPDLGIAWPIDIDVDDPALLSQKDRTAPTFAEIRAASEMWS